uniref:Secreted protein n=1 Tax=Parascaris univalens TaxID=6257 RepID=A0A915BUX4_PARUN
MHLNLGAHFLNAVVRQKLFLLVMMLVTPCPACLGGICCCCIAGSKNMAAHGRPIPLGNGKMMAVAGGGSGISLLASATEKSFVAPRGLRGSAPAETAEKA